MHTQTNFLNPNIDLLDTLLFLTIPPQYITVTSFVDRVLVQSRLGEGIYPPPPQKKKERKVAF